MDTRIARFAPVRLEFLHARADNIATVMTTVVEHDFSGWGGHFWGRNFGSFTLETLDPKFFGNLNYKFLWRVFVGTQEDNVLW